MDASILVTALTVISAAIGWLWKNIYSTKKQLEEDNRRCEEKNSNLEQRVMLLEADTEGNLPEWKKDSKGKFIWCNGAFVSFALAPLNKGFDDIQGKTNREIDFWDSDLQNIMNKLDVEASREGYAVKINVLFHSLSKYATINKTIIKTKGSPVIYYHGYATPQKEKIVI